MPLAGDCVLVAVGTTVGVRVGLATNVADAVAVGVRVGVDTNVAVAVLTCVGTVGTAVFVATRVGV